MIEWSTVERRDKPGFQEFDVDVDFNDGVKVAGVLRMRTTTGNTDRDGIMIPLKAATNSRDFKFIQMAQTNSAILTQSVVDLFQQHPQSGDVLLDLITPGGNKLLTIEQLDSQNNQGSPFAINGKSVNERINYFATNLSRAFTDFSIQITPTIRPHIELTQPAMAIKSAWTTVHRGLNLAGRDLPR